MTKVLKALFNWPWRARHAKVESRLCALEMAFEVVLNSPRYLDAPEIGFNGQACRKDLFEDLVRLFSFDVVVETGTFWGDTAGFIASHTAASVSTCEVNSLFACVARHRLTRFPQVQIHSSDSRAFLRKMIDSPDAGLKAAQPFFYLDAHWGADLPLADEIDIIGSKCAQAVIMIDDFCVPGDTGYGYDAYGKAKTLDLATFGKCFSRHDLVPFFPAARSTDETGAKRGCVVLGAVGNVSRTLERSRRLRR